MSDRGQIHTLEAVIAALLIVGALLFASQATAVTPLSASTSNQHIENQQRTVAGDLLDHAARDGSLTAALTFWETSEEPAHFAYADLERGTYSDISELEGHPLEDGLIDAFGAGVYAYNLEAVYMTEDKDFDSIAIIVMGSPSDNAVTASRTVTLFEGDEMYDGTDLNNDNGKEFWAPNVADGAIYNVVEVRLTVWRM